MHKILKKWQGIERTLRLEVGAVTLEGLLCIPNGASGIVVFVHGSGSSRHSPRNQFVANGLNAAGLGTLLFDLLTKQEESLDEHTAQFRFDIDLLAERVITVTEWLGSNSESGRLHVGYFGASTGAAAALVGASKLPDIVKAVVSRGGRPDLATTALKRILVPTLLIVGEQDPVVLDLNEQALKLLPGTIAKSIRIVPRATHLFREPGALEQVESLTCQWFSRYLVSQMATV